MEDKTEQLLVLPAEYLQHAGQNLPELTGELLSAQTFQCSELRQKEERLLKLQADLRQMQQNFDSTNKLVRSSLRSICLKEDLLAELGQDCECMERELFILALEKQELEADLDGVKKERVTDESLRIDYNERMDQYKIKMSEIKATPIQLEIQTLKLKISRAREKRESYFKEGDLEQLLTGETQRCLLEQIAAVQNSKQVILQEHILLEDAISANKQKIQVLTKDIETERKRQGAQLRRLQRLVNEAHARKRQWVQEGETLRSSIRHIKCRIKE